MTQGKRLTDQQRGRVIGFLLAGESIAATAKRSGVSVKSVERIKASAEMTELVALKRESEPSLNELVTEHLTTALQATIALAKRIQHDDAWFASQSAGEIGNLYGILSDKAVRLFDAKLRADRLAFDKLQLEE